MKRRANASIYITIILLLAIFAIYIANRPLQTLIDLLRENENLRTAITNLSKESVIGYATILKRVQTDAGPEVTCRFVEVDRNDRRIPLSSKDFLIKGDEIYFDAIIVKFDSSLVKDGKEKAMYLWRRVFGNKMKPEEGLNMNTPGVEAKRYNDLASRLSLPEKETFWKEIWDLSNNVEKMAKQGIRAVNGQAAYAQLEEGKIYKFLIGNDGNLTIEVDLDPRSVPPSDIK